MPYYKKRRFIEKSIHSVLNQSYKNLELIIVYDDEILRSFLLGHNILNFIVNRCYNMSCHELLLLNENIINRNQNWNLHNLYVMPDAKNRFTTCK